MFRSITLKVTSRLLIGGAFCVARVEAANDCVSALSIEAPPSDRASFRSRLSRGRLRTIDVMNCRGSKIRLAPLGNGWKLSFANGTTLMTRDVASTEIAAVWVESWLVPGTEVEPLREASPSSMPLEGAAPGTTFSRVTFGQAMEASVAATLASESIWLGPELSYRQSIGRGFFLAPRFGMAYAITNRPDDASRLLRASTALGWFFYRSTQMSLGPAVDLGVSSMVWQARERGIQSAGPTLGLSFVAERLLTGSVWFVAKVEVLPWFTDRIETNQKRVYLSEHDDKPNTMETVVSKELLQANLMGALSLGVSIRWGDFQ